MKLVAFADLHLDTTFSWANRDVARTRRRNLRESLRRTVELAHEVQADVLLCGGDLYEDAYVTPDTVSFLSDTFNECEMPVVLAPGNHDWLGPSSPYAQVNWESHVHLFQEPRLSPFVLEEGFTICGGAHTRPAGTPGFFDSDFSASGDGVHIALFHGAEKGFFAFEHGYDSHKEPHAGFRESQIHAAGLDYAFVGHYHHPRDSTHLTYPGNPDPLSFGEESRRGAVVAEVGSDGTVAITRYDVAVSEVHDVSLDLTGSTSANDVREAAATAVDGLSGCIRLTLYGELAPEIDLRLEDFDGLSDEADQIVPRLGEITVAYDLEALAEDPTVRGQFVRTVTGDPTLDDDVRRRVIVTGLRALDGRSDLGVE